MESKKLFIEGIDSRLSWLVADANQLSRIISETRQPHMKKFRRWRITLAAACFVFLLSLTALAAGLGAFEKFFDNNASVISDYTTVIGKSVENNGIIFTVEEAYTSEESGFVVGAFTKSDGTIFEDDIEPWLLDEKGNYINKNDKKYKWLSVSRFEFSDDRKSLFVLFRIAKHNELNPERTMIIGVQNLCYQYRGWDDVALKGPWIMEITLPPDVLMKQYTLNCTYKNDEKKIEFVGVKMSPDLFLFEVKGDVELAQTALSYLKYGYEDGTEDIIGASVNGYTKLGEEHYRFVYKLTWPVNIDKLKYIKIMGNKVLLKSSN